MTQFVQFLVGGASLGGVYALLALGFVMVFRASGVVNFAHPALVMIGAYTIGRLATATHAPFAVTLLAGIAAAALAALIIQRVLVRPMAARSVIAVSIMTLGVDVVIQTEITRRIGADILSMHDPWRDRVVQVGALIPRTRVSALAWTLAGALAAVAGLFITVFPSPGLESATAAVALRAFPAAIIGGLDSTGGAVAGGLIVGVAEVLSQGYAADLSFLGPGFHTVMPYLVMVVVLLARPAGLFGTRELHRV